MTDFVIPKKIISYLIRVQKEYENAECDLEKNLIESARVFVREAVDYDNWGGDTYTHDIVMYVPLQVAAMIPLENQEGICKDICEKLSHCSKSVGNERIGAVYIETNNNDDIEFKQSVPIARHEHANHSGDDDTILRSITKQDQNRIWGKFPLRMFISHKNDNKTLAKNIKDCLSRYGVACFVAHEDIKVTQEWQDEIEKALATMHILVPLLTENFNDSEWTDQEVGVAIGRGVLIVSVRMGKDPYGFIGKYQGMVGTDRTSADIACDLYEIFLKNEKTKELAKESFLYAAKNSKSFDESNRLAKFLSKIESLSDEQTDRLCAIYRDNGQIRSAHGFNGVQGQGLIYHLKRMTGDTYVVDRNHVITKENTENTSTDLYDEIPF